jgi:hypothetical protein
MRKQLLNVLILLAIVSCNSSSTLTNAEKETVEKEVHQALENYCNDVRRSGLTAELHYLDSSAEFSWLPPGYSDSISYDSVVTILKLNASKYKTVDNTFEILEIIPISKTLASYSGRVRSVMTLTTGKAMTFVLSENGEMIKRNDGWKLLKGKTTFLVADRENDDYMKHIVPAAIFTLSDAEKILGEPAHLTDSVSATKGQWIYQFNSTYTANSADTKSGKTGNIYFMFEEYHGTVSAKEVYSSIKKSNEDHEGIETLTGYGDEAYFHTDNENFYFILVRKKNLLFRLKVNKITSKTSIEEFKTISKRIANNLYPWVR